MLLDIFNVECFNLISRFSLFYFILLYFYFNCFLKVK